MEWPATLSDGDTLIIRENTKGGPRFVVRSRLGPQLSCLTYAEAESRACSYAAHAGTHAWFVDHRGPQLISPSQSTEFVS
jgi:hypothetical protein